MRRKTKADSRRKTQADARRKTQADVPRTTDVWYVYGFVRPGFDASKAPAGLDDVPVTVTQTDKAAALVSRLPTSGYAAEAVERNTADVSWLSPRAVAHDRVLTWAQEHGGVLPLPMFSLWRSE